MPRPTLSVLLPNYGPSLAGNGSYQPLLDTARELEAAGVDRIVVVDHVVMGHNLDAYAWGRFPTLSDAPWLEPLTVLAAVAAVTTRIRLATGIIIAPLRGAAVLAKTAATVDVLSGGRLDLGVGTGWQAEEYAAAGLDWARRGRLLSDTLEACRLLWQGGPATVELETVTLPGVYCQPTPLQPGGVPIWVSGSLSDAVLERVVRWSAGWLPIMGATAEDIRAGVIRIHAALRAAGRDPAGFEVRAPLPLPRDAGGHPDLAAAIAGLPALLTCGVTDVQVHLQALPPGGVSLLVAAVAAAERPPPAPPSA